MQIPDRQTPASQVETAASPVDVARSAIWRLFQEGYLDEDMATAGLLAVDLGTRRGPRAGRTGRPPSRAHSDHAAPSRIPPE